MRKDANTTVRPTLDDLPPIAANEKSIKNFPAPLNCRNAPKIVKRIMSVDETSTAVPKTPSSVMYMNPTSRDRS
jgi:hypothetical protein